MRIGIDALSVIPRAVGGSEIYIYELTRGLLEADRGNEYFLFLSAANETRFANLQHSNLSKIIVRYPSNNRVSRIAAQQFSLPKYLRDLRLDICHFPGTTMTLRSPCPSVVTVQSLHCYLYPESFSPIRRAYLSYMTAASVRRADAIIVPSQHCRHQMVSLLNTDAEKIFVIPEGIRASDFVAADEQLIDRFGLKRGEYIFSPCHFLPYKNLEVAIRAYHLVKSREYLPHKFVIAGCISDERYYRKIKALVQTLGLQDDFVYVGSLPHADMTAFYRGSLFCVYPSLCETFGLPVLEAMASATPVICSNRSSLPEVAGKAALLVESSDPIKLSRAMYQVLKNATVRQMLVTEGLQHVKAFDWSRAAIGTLEVFNRLRQLKRGATA